MNKPKTLKGVIESSKNISGIIGNSISITGGIQAIGRDGIGLDFHWDGTKLGVKKENEKEYQYVDLRGKSTIDDLTDKHIYKALGYVPASTESLKREVYHLQVRDKEHDSLIKTLFEEIENLQIKVGESELSITELYELIDILDKTKANLSDVPAKLSDLEIDMEIGKDFTEEIKVLTQNIIELSEIKSDILYVDEQIGLLSDNLKTKIDNNNSRIDVLKSDLNKHIELANIQYNELIRVVNSKATIVQVKELQKQIEELDIPEHIDLKPIENDMNKLFNLVEAKADKSTVNEELNKLQVQLDNLDIPEGVDLTPVYDELNKLKTDKANISDVPTKVSQLDNDAQYITITDVPDIDLTDVYKDLDNIKTNLDTLNSDVKSKANKADIPTNISQLYNDKNYITLEDVPECDLSDIESSIAQLQTLISNKADKTYVDSQISIIEEQIDNLDIPNEVDLTPIYNTLESLSNSKANTTYVNIEVARLEKMIGELVGGEDIDLSDYALKKDIPRDLSQLSNDVGYITITDIPEVDLTDINKHLIDLQNKKANKLDVIEDINKLQQEIDNLDIPEEVDLKPIQDSLELLKENKADVSYVQSEVGKLNESITNAIFNVSENYALKDELPMKVSELDNDIEFITIDEVPKVDLSDIKNNITNLENTKADKVELPTKLSDLQNDTGYITVEEVDLMEIETNLTELENKCITLELKKSDITYVDNEIKKIRDLIDGIDIPEDVDLRPILKRIEELELYIDAELTKKVDKAEYISDIREIQNKLSGHGLDIAELNGEIVIVNSELKKKADATYVDTRLNGYYKKSETYTKDEVNNRITQIIGNAPENLDTLEKLADALDNDDSFASTITKELTNKVDKIDGKGLSSNDYTNTEKLKLDGIEDGANKTTKISELANDVGYITLKEIGNIQPQIDKLSENIINNKSITDLEISNLKDKNLQQDIEINKRAFQSDLQKLKDTVGAIDIPEEVDLAPIISDIEKLDKTKAEKTELNSEVSRLEKTIKDIVTGEAEDKVRIIPYITDTPIMNEIYYKQIEKKPPVSHWYPDDWGVWEVVSQNHLKCKATKTYDALTTKITGNKGIVDIKIVKEDKSDKHMLELVRDGRSVFNIRETKGDKEYNLRVKPGDRLTITSLFAGDVYLDYHGEDGDHRLYAYKNGVEERIANAYLIEKRLEDYITRIESESAIELLDNTKANKEHTHENYEYSINQLQKEINDLDIPDEVDLEPVYSLINKKSDITYVDNAVMIADRYYISDTPPTNTNLIWIDSSNSEAHGLYDDIEVIKQYAIDAKQIALSKSDKLHNHQISDIDNLINVLDSKSPQKHTHSIDDIGLLNEQLKLKSDLLHTHTSDDITHEHQTLSKVLNNKANKNHVDMLYADLKQSGDKSNKILVDNLISKDIDASTSDPISVNVTKVKDIKVGEQVDDYTLSAGSWNLIAGNMQEGFFGFVPASEMFTSKELSDMLGFHEGNLINNSEPWLKFAWEGKILFRPLKSIRDTVSYENIADHSLVYGDRVVSKNNTTFKVRLMKGASVDPAPTSLPDRGAKGSEWNRLVLPLHKFILDGNWEYKSNVESNLQDWGMYLDNDDLYLHTDGRYVWCQEQTDSGNYLTKGWGGVSFSGSSPINHKYKRSGWCPVLEVVV